MKDKKFKKLMTSFKLQKNLHRQLLRRIIEDGYGMRGKSRWIVESVEALLAQAGFPELVDIADDMDQLTEMVSIRIPEQLMKRIENAVITVRRQYPTIEGVRSNLIRASIVQRLLK